MLLKPRQVPRAQAVSASSTAGLHESLQQAFVPMVGNWDVRSIAYIDTSAAPGAWQGSMQIEWDLGGAWLRSRLKMVGPAGAEAENDTCDTFNTHASELVRHRQVSNGSYTRAASVGWQRTPEGETALVWEGETFNLGSRAQVPSRTIYQRIDDDLFLMHEQSLLDGTWTSVIAFECRRQGSSDMATRTTVTDEARFCKAWQMVETNNMAPFRRLDRLSPGKLPRTEVTPLEVYQIIEAKTRRFDNVVRFQLDDGSTEGVMLLRGKYAIASPHRVDVRFDSVAVRPRTGNDSNDKWVAFFGGDTPVDGKIEVPVGLPPTLQMWNETTYLDDTKRSCHGNVGGTYELRAVDQPSAEQQAMFTP